MTLKETLKELENYSDKKVLARNIKNGAGDNQFGVKLGDIRKLAKKIKIDHKLALALWKSKNIDARLLAILVIEPKTLSTEEVDEMVKTINFDQVADWFNSYIVKNHSKKEELREKWMLSDDPMSARAGWNLTAQRIAKAPEGLDLTAILDRIEAEMGKTASAAQWTMNFALAEIGIHFPEHRKRALAIGEKLGIYRDYPVSKGCTSPFAPIWIKAMVERQS